MTHTRVAVAQLHYTPAYTSAQGRSLLTNPLYTAKTPDDPLDGLPSSLLPQADALRAHPRRL